MLTACSVYLLQLRITEQAVSFRRASGERHVYVAYGLLHVYVYSVCVLYSFIMTSVKHKQGWKLLYSCLAFFM